MSTQTHKDMCVDTPFMVKMNTWLKAIVGYTITVETAAQSHISIVCDLVPQYSHMKAIVGYTIVTRHKYIITTP